MKTFLEVAKYVVGAIAVVSAMTLLAIDKSLMPEGMIQKFFTQYGAYIGLTSLLLMLLADSLEVRIPDPIPFVHVEYLARYGVIGWVGFACSGLVALAVSALWGWASPIPGAIVGVMLVSSAVPTAISLLCSPKPSKASQR